jgi:hypothetical protein
MQAITNLSKIFTALDDVPRAISLFEAALEADRFNPLPKGTSAGSNNFRRRKVANAPVVSENLRSLYEEEEADDDDEEIVGFVDLVTGRTVSVRVGFEALVVYVGLLRRMEMYDKAVEEVCEVTQRILEVESLENVDWSLLPIDLRVELGICLVWIDELGSAKVHLYCIFTIADYFAAFRFILKLCMRSLLMSILSFI